MRMPNFPDKLLFAIVLAILIFLFFHKYFALFKPQSNNNEVQPAENLQTNRNLFWGFDKENDKLDEIWLPEKSSNKNWWLNSGAYFYIKDFKGYTVQNELSDNDEWRLKYMHNTPSETDNGYHPQNIFRLISKAQFKDTEQELHFIIHKYHLSESENRNESNAVLLFSDYEDSDNLYYSGLRIDGTAIIKRKCETRYETLLQAKILDGQYDKEISPNLLNSNHEYALKVITTHDENDNANIKLYIKLSPEPDWKLIGDATDTNSCRPNTNSSVGIRTDFMDVEFTKYSVKTLKTTQE